MQSLLRCAALMLISIITFGIVSGLLEELKKKEKKKLVAFAFSPRGEEHVTQ